MKMMAKGRSEGCESDCGKRDPVMGMRRLVGVCKFKRSWKQKQLAVARNTQCLLHLGVCLANCYRGWAQHCIMTLHLSAFRLCCHQIQRCINLHWEEEWRREWGWLFEATSSWIYCGAISCTVLCILCVWSCFKTLAANFVSDLVLFHTAGSHRCFRFDLVSEYWFQNAGSLFCFRFGLVSEYWFQNAVSQLCFRFGLVSECCQPTLFQIWSCFRTQVSEWWQPALFQIWSCFRPLVASLVADVFCLQSISTNMKKKKEKKNVSQVCLKSQRGNCWWWWCCCCNCCWWDGGDLQEVV